MHIQSQELAVIQLKAKEDGERMSAQYAESRMEARKMQEVVQNTEEKAQRERMVAE